MATQNEQIRKYLEAGNTLTPLEALNLFGCFRLATRIFELKKQGLNILTDIVEDAATGKRYAKYRLNPEGSVEAAVPSALPACPVPLDDELF